MGFVRKDISTTSTFDTGEAVIPVTTPTFQLWEDTTETTGKRWDLGNDWTITTLNDGTELNIFQGSENRLQINDEGYVQTVAEDGVDLPQLDAGTSAADRILQVNEANDGLKWISPNEVISDAGVTTSIAELNYVDGVTSSIQDQLDAKHATIDSGSRLNVTYIANGLISNTEFDYLNGLTGTIQTQLDAKHSTIDASNRLNTIYIGDDSSVSNTEFGYLDGVTSAIQTQIDGKLDNITIDTSITDGSTNTVQNNAIFDALALKQPLDAQLTTLAAMGSTHVAALVSLQATEFQVLDGATLTTDELNYVDGVTSSIQTQLDSKQASGSYQTEDADLTALSSCQAGSAAALALLTSAEIEILDDATVTTTELNYVDGVTSNIQTQLDGKQASGSYQPEDSDLTYLSSMQTGASAALQVLTAVEIGKLDGLTSGTGELNLLDGAIASVITDFRCAVYGDSGLLKATTLETTIADCFNLIVDGGTATFSQETDLKAYGTDANNYLLFDSSADQLTLQDIDLTMIDADMILDGSLIIGADTVGFDFRTYGATTLKSIYWDASEDHFWVFGDMTISGGSTSILNSVTVGIDTNGHDVKFFGDTSGAFLEWDATNDDLLIIGNNITLDSAGDLDLPGTISLTTDSEEIKLGEHGDVILKHSHDTGLIIKSLSAVHDDVVNVLDLQVFSSGTASDNFGAGISFHAQNDAGVRTEIGAFSCIMTDASDGTVDSEFAWESYRNDVGGETMRLDAGGSLTVARDMKPTGVIAMGGKLITLSTSATTSGEADASGIDIERGNGFNPGLHYSEETIDINTTNRKGCAFVMYGETEDRATASQYHIMGTKIAAGAPDTNDKAEGEGSSFYYDQTNEKLYICVDSYTNVIP